MFDGIKQYFARKARLARQDADEFLRDTGHSLRYRSHATIPDRSKIDDSRVRYHSYPF
jgi:hypothetical protein